MPEVPVLAGVLVPLALAFLLGGVGALFGLWVVYGQIRSLTL